MIVATEATSGTTCVIRAKDFSDSTKDDDRNRWTGGKLRHVLAALGDSPVIITTDTQTGHTAVNVRLTGLREKPYGGGYQVAVAYNYADGSGQTLWHRLDDLGDTIVPLSGADNAKWAAKKSYQDDASYAVELAQAQHGKGAGREWGNWKAHVGFTEVSVTYTPYPDTYADVAPRGQRGFWSYKLAEVAAQGCMRQLHMHKLYPTEYPAPVSQADVCDNPWHRGLFAYMPCADCTRD